MFIMCLHAVADLKVVMFTCLGIVYLNTVLRLGNDLDKLVLSYFSYF